MFPSAWGGPEMSLPKQVELIEVLAHADAATAWCVKIGSDSGLFAAWLEERAARELYRDLDYITAGQAPPNGRALEIDGGYRVTGRWGFGSGCTPHADVIVGGCVVVGGDGQPIVSGGVPRVIHVLAPASGGESSIGSRTALRAAAAITTRRRACSCQQVTCSISTPSSKRDEALYRLPITASVSIPMAGVPLGIARRAIDELLRHRGSEDRGDPAAARAAQEPAARASAVAAGRKFARRGARLRVRHRRTPMGRGRDARLRLDNGASRRRTCADPRSSMACDVAQLMFDTAGPAAVYAGLAARPFASRRGHDQSAPAVQRRRARRARRDGVRRRGAVAVRLADSTKALTIVCHEVVLRVMHDQHWTRRAADDFFRDAAGDQMIDEPLAVLAHHDELDGELLRARHDRVAGAARRAAQQVLGAGLAFFLGRQ